MAARTFNITTQVYLAYVRHDNGNLDSINITPYVNAIDHASTNGTAPPPCPNIVNSILTTGTLPPGMNVPAGPPVPDHITLEHAIRALTGHILPPPGNPRNAPGAPLAPPHAPGGAAPLGIHGTAPAPGMPPVPPGAHAPGAPRVHPAPLGTPGTAPLAPGGHPAGIPVPHAPGGLAPGGFPAPHGGPGGVPVPTSGHAPPFAHYGGHLHGIAHVHPGTQDGRGPHLPRTPGHPPQPPHAPAAGYHPATDPHGLGHRPYNAHFAPHGIPVAPGHYNPPFVTPDPHAPPGHTHTDPRRALQFNDNAAHVNTVHVGPPPDYKFKDTSFGITWNEASETNIVYGANASPTRQSRPEYKHQRHLEQGYKELIKLMVQSDQERGINTPHGTDFTDRQKCSRAGVMNRFRRAFPYFCSRARFCPNVTVDEKRKLYHRIVMCFLNEQMISKDVQEQADPESWDLIYNAVRVNTGALH